MRNEFETNTFRLHIVANVDLRGAQCFRCNNQNGTEGLLCFPSSNTLLAFIMFPFEFKHFWKKISIARLCNNTVVDGVSFTRVLYVYVVGLGFNLILFRSSRKLHI